jgi:hypothetical protein
MPWSDVLKADPTEWLLEPSDPSVLLWALRDLLDRKESDPEVEAARVNVMKSPLVRCVLEAQSPEGHWVSRDDMYLPKYRATTHSLLILAELGVSRTPAIERGLEHIFEFQRDSGHFLTKLPKTSRGRASPVKDGCCLDGNVLYYMIYFGLLRDPRVGRLIDFIADYHSAEDGGWRCRAYPINPDRVFPKNCYMGAMKVLRALARIPTEDRSGEVNEIIEVEAENILENGIYWYLRNPDGTRKEKAGWKRFGFPLFYQSDVLEALDTLTSLGLRDERMQGAVDLVLESQRSDGTWLLRDSFNGKMWCDIDVKGEPSKWITLRAMRVLRRFYGD